ncbi:glycosyltransferase [Georgenia thermotolerans]|uniref:Glycosyltransferase n=1 Tax=Georgenia thermotolerans TaxID=527326 RepID=A0A7J5URV0_9MICO|nr:glycosyltransferase [Georgenia thermotolerans]KAE8764543.1 glycosyltransferase [Georgenia thermotolerans]
MADGFSVLLPVYAGDDAGHFRQAVSSATAQQSLRPAELVVVRDGPVGEALAEVLRELKEAGPTSPAGDVPVRIVELADNQGLAVALERGLAACAHEIVARADADDISLPQRFAVQVPLVAGGLDLLGSAITEFVDDPAVPGMSRVLPAQAAEISATARFRDPFNHPSVVYRRSAVSRAGGYQHLDLLEDYWLFARMIATGARVANVPEPLVLYRVGAGAYRRRGGVRLLKAELQLQWRFRAAGFTSVPQFLRNVVVRGGYRLVPEPARRLAYRRMISPARR